MAPSETRQSTSGSPSSGEPVYITVGKLHRSHGLRGEIVMEVLTDFPERLRARKEVFIGEEHESLRIDSVRVHGSNLLIRFLGIDDPEAASRLANQMVFVLAEKLPPLPQGEYYFHQLVGLKVIDRNDVQLGYLTEILETGANDVYIIRNDDDEELLIPALDSVIQEVNLDEKYIRVDPPEWA